MIRFGEHVKPMFHDHCNHVKCSFAGHVSRHGEWHDVRFFKDAGGWHYCMRYGDREDEYLSGYVEPSGNVGFSESIPMERRVEILKEDLNLLSLWWYFTKQDN